MAKSITYRCFLFFLSLFFSTASFANPASTEYVNKRLQELNDEIHHQIELLEEKVNAKPVKSFKIGDPWQGGIIFYLDASGSHGLIAARSDLNSNYTWQNGEMGDKTVNAIANGLGAGRLNTNMIIAQQTVDDQEGQFAALAVSKFSIAEDGVTSCSSASVCYGDWYLPSIYELKLLNDKQDLVGGFAKQPYWTSNEASVSEAYVLDFEIAALVLLPKIQEAKIRPVRAF